MIRPGSIIHADPRRLGNRAMLAVWCFCGRFYTVTPEEARRHSKARTNPCPACSTQEAAA